MRALPYTTVRFIWGDYSRSDYKSFGYMEGGKTSWTAEQLSRLQKGLWSNS
jgi:hypothetical protein